MKLEYIKKENKKETILITCTNEKEVEKRLLYELYSITINKMKKRVKYTYNYTDKQTIDFIDNTLTNTYITRISDIPTKMGIIDIDRLESEVK